MMSILAVLQLSNKYRNFLAVNVIFKLTHLMNLSVLIFAAMFIYHVVLFICSQSVITVRYSNIFITAPSPENLKAVHEFIFKGFEALHYQVPTLLLTLSHSLHQIFN